MKCELFPNSLQKKLTDERTLDRHRDKLNNLATKRDTDRLKNRQNFITENFMTERQNDETKKRNKAKDCVKIYV